MRISLLAVLAAPFASAAPAADTCSTASKGISPARAAQVQKAFASGGVIPDVVPAISPATDFQLSYGSKKMDLGNTYSLVETLAPPTYSFTAESGFDPSTTKYTIIYVDPDAPGPELPLLRLLVHYIEYNVQPTCIKSQSPTTLASYQPLTPLSLSKHRYTYLVYRQTLANYKPSLDPVTLVSRAPFDLNKFVKDGQLVLVGGNYMTEGLNSTQCALTPNCTKDGRA